MGWSGNKAFVTGAGGFIASHLCEELVKLGANVTALVHYNSRNDWGNLEELAPEIKKSLNVVLGNIEDASFMREVIRGQEIVFHLAALIAIPYSYSAALSYVRTNVEGTLSVLEACRAANVKRMIHTSTSETYGSAVYTPIDERHPLQGQSPYSASKIGADMLAESYYRSFELPVSTVRPFNTYGPRQSARAFIPTAICQALTEETIRLGSLSPVRDLTFVKDTVRGFIAVAASEKCIGTVTNIGTGEGHSVGEVVNIILNLMSCKKRVVLDDQRIRPEKSEVLKLICNNAKAEELANWKPGYSLEQGLKETIEYISNHIDLYKTQQYTV